MKTSLFWINDCKKKLCLWLQNKDQDDDTSQEVDESLEMEESVSEGKMTEDSSVSGSEKMTIDSSITDKVEVAEHDKSETNFSQKLPTKWSVCNIRFLLTRH